MTFYLDKRYYFYYHNFQMPEAMNFDFLVRAANNSERITLFHYTEQGKKLTFGSRFFEMDSNGKYIIIAQPFGEGDTYQSLVRKDEIEVFFVEKGFRFMFPSQVLKRDKFKLHGDAETPVLIIKCPKDIFDGERRNFFRVPVPVDPPMPILYRSYFESGQSFEETGEFDIADINMNEMLIHDLSGGGLSFRGKLGSMDVMVGDIINMKFKLRKGEKTIRIEGLINNSRKSADGKATIKGIEFMPDRSDEYRSAIKKISRYVMERQREMITPLGKKF